MIDEKFYYILKLNLTNELEERKLFIKNLEQNLKKIIGSTTKTINNIKNSKLIKQNKIKYIPEKLTLSSPITLLKGSEFSGKTTFIESICESISNNEIPLTYIDKIKVINLLNYFTYFQSETSFNLFVKDILDVIDNKEIKNNIQKFLSIDFVKNNTNKLNINFDLILEVNKKINKPILFVIDNIEKIGLNFEIVLGVIYKLSFINNFAFLFIVNENFSETSDDYSNKNNEYVDRNHKILLNFVNLPIYKFNQDYSCLLKKFDIGSKLTDDLNNLLIKEYKPTLKELNNLLITLIDSDTHVNKYKFLASLYNRFPSIQSTISNIIYDNTKLFSDYLDSLNELKNYKLITSEEFVNKHLNLSGLTNIDNRYWENSGIKFELELYFKDTYSKCNFYRDWTKYKYSLLTISKKINDQILNIESEIKSTKERGSANRILKTNKNKINIDNLFSVENNNINDENFEISHLESLNDQLIAGDLEEIKKTNDRLKEIDVILLNLKVIKKDLETYFYNLDKNTKELQEKMNNLFETKKFKDDIDTFNSALSDSKVKSFLKEYDSYKELSKLKSLKDIFNIKNLNVLNEIIRFTNYDLNDYIINSYSKLD